MTSTAQFARIAAALDMTDAELRADTVDTLRTVGALLPEWGTCPAATREGLQVGDLVAVYAHQRIRIAKVWNLTPTKLSAVYVTPSEVDRVAKLPAGFDVFPNSITAKIADCELVRSSAPAPAAPASAGEVEVEGGVQLPQQTRLAFCDDELVLF